MFKSVFTLGEIPYAYMGYTKGNSWNGYATPYFERNEAIRIMEHFNKYVDNHMYYDEGIDAFRVDAYEDIDEVICKGGNYCTDDGIKRLYEIGTYSWVWDEVIDQDCRFLAEVIEDFIYEYDTYEAKDQYDDREEMVEGIENQLKELTVYQKVYEAWHSEELSEEELFNRLQELINV